MRKQRGKEIEKLGKRETMGNSVGLKGEEMESTWMIKIGRERERKRKMKGETPVFNGVLSR